jgi:hypothetical protein
VKEENRGKPYRESPATAGASGSSGASDCWWEATARWSRAAFPNSAAEAAGEQAFNAHSKWWAPQRTPLFYLWGGGGHTPLEIALLPIIFSDCNSPSALPPAGSSKGKDGVTSGSKGTP